MTTEPMKLDEAGLEAAKTAINCEHFPERELMAAQAIAAYLQTTRPDAGELVRLLSREDVRHALEIGRMGRPYSDVQGYLYMAEQYRGHASAYAAQFTDYGLAHAACVLFNAADDILRAIERLSTAPAGDVVVKPLEWEEIAATDHIATTIIGRYHIVGSGNSWSVGFPGKPDRDYFSTIAEAKAAAQADYEQRIRSALAPTPSQTSPATEGEVVGWRWPHTNGGWNYWWGPTPPPYADRLAVKPTPLYDAPPPAKAGEGEGKYDEVLKPFLAMMERELHANSGKGDRPGWLAMSREELLLEIYYHLAKLQKAVRKDEADGIREFGADVANMSMMVVDKCAALLPQEKAEQ